MRVIIIGAGKLGEMITETLSKSNMDVIVIDQSDETINRINETHDVLGIKSNGLVGGSLKNIGIGKNDLVIAVTGSDEANMLACMSAKAMGAGKTIARIRNPEYTKDFAITKEQLSIDFVVNPERSTALEIYRLLRSSLAGKFESFCKDRVKMIEVAIDKNSNFANKAIKDIDVKNNILIAAILREGDIKIPKGDDEILVNDNIFIVGENKDIEDFCISPDKVCKHVKNVMVFGGGKMSYYLIEKLLQSGISVKVIEKNNKRCRDLAIELPDALVINGDGTDIELLKSENISTMDAFVASTSIDEENIIVSLLVKRLGVKRVISRINKLNNANLVETLGIDAAITPSEITASEIMRIIWGNNISNLSIFFGGRVEAIEFVASDESEKLNIPINKIKFPKKAIIAAITRDSEVIIPHGNDVIKKGDNVIILSGLSEMETVRKLFNIKKGIIRDGFWDYIKNFGINTNR